jgi:hypothetical protein
MSNFVRVLLVAIVLTAPAAIHATTIVPLDDDALVDQAALVVRARVVGELPNTTERPVTDWLMQVERVLKGEHAAGSLTVRVLGGETPSGDILEVFGAPRFRPDETVLLFLTPRYGSDAFEILHFMQGVFHRVAAGNRSVAAQDLARVQVLPKRFGRQLAPRRLRNFDAFEQWIVDSAAGVVRHPDYEFEASRDQLSAVHQEFTLFVGAGFNIRWFEFDSGGSVLWYNNGGLSGLTNAGFTEFSRALAVWNNEPTTPVRLLYAGSTTASAGFTARDLRNTVLFGDPNGEIADLACSGSNAGGVLAIAGIWSQGATLASFNGKTYWRAPEADFIVNNNLECLFPLVANRSRWVERLFGHELGHTLGIDHSSEKKSESNTILRNALMYFTVGFSDTRGAVLNSDDVAALQALYRRRSGGGGAPPSPSGCPAGTAADTLCLLKGRFHLTGTWQNQFDGSSGVLRPIVNSDLSGFFYFTDKNNVELIVKVLNFGSEIKVFYSQLTNLKFTLNVRDTTTGRVKVYNNTPGDCGAIDPNFLLPTAALTAESTATASLALPATASCKADASTLCLLDNRFAVTVTWRNQFNGASGVGKAKPLSRLTGAFAFDDPANLEILIKTLSFSGKILVLYGSLSNFEYTIRVTDTTTGQFKEYRNAAGNYCGGLDSNAF